MCFKSQTWNFRHWSKQLLHIAKEGFPRYPRFRWNGKCSTIDGSAYHEVSLLPQVNGMLLIHDRPDALTLAIDPTVAMALEFDNFGVSINKTCTRWQECWFYFRIGMILLNVCVACSAFPSALIDMLSHLSSRRPWTWWRGRWLRSQCEKGQEESQVLFNPTRSRTGAATHTGWIPRPPPFNLLRRKQFLVGNRLLIITSWCSRPYGLIYN